VVGDPSLLTTSDGHALNRYLYSSLSAKKEIEPWGEAYQRGGVLSLSEKKGGKAENENSRERGESGW